MPEYYNYLAVIGRIPGDDEDSIFLYEHKSRQEAIQAFKRDIYADVEDAESEREWHLKNNDCAAFINLILTSEAPIMVS